MITFISTLIRKSIEDSPYLHYFNDNSLLKEVRKSSDSFGYHVSFTLNAFSHLMKSDFDYLSSAFLKNGMIIGSLIIRACVDSDCKPYLELRVYLTYANR